MPLKGFINVLDEFLVPETSISVYHEVQTVQPIYMYDMHYALEFGILLSGRERRLCGDRSDITEPGDVWFHGVWEPHGVELLDLPSEVLVFAVSPQAMVGIGSEEMSEYDWM